MLRYLRENTGNWIIKFFLAIIVIVFVFLGVGSMNANKRNEVAVVNDQAISFGEFQDAYKNMIGQMRQRFGNALNDDLIKALNVKQQAINSLIDQKLMDLEADKLEILVSDQELKDALLSVKAFQRDGAFDLDLYKRVLAQNGMSPESFEALQRRAIKNNKLRDMVLNGITVSDEEARIWYRFNNTKTAIDYIKIDPATFTQIKPTEAQIQAQYKGKPELYKSESLRKVLYLVFSPEDHRGKSGITDEQIREFYEQNKDRFTTKEQVEASHILIKVDENADEAAVTAAREKADQIYEKAVSGADFVELAKKHSQGPSGPNGGYLGKFDRRSMVKPFGDAAFAMKAGEVSKPVRTRFGWHIIKLKGRIPQTVTSFESAKPVILKELEDQELLNLAYYKSGEAFDAVMDGDDFEQVALIANKKLIETPAFDASGRGLDMEAPGEFARAAFALVSDEISEVKQIGDKYYLIKVVEKIAPKQLPIEAVKDKIVQTLTASQQKEAASKLAQEVLKKIQSGTSLAEAAKENKLAMTASPMFARTQPVQGIPGSVEIAGAAFTLGKEKPVYDKVLEAGGQFYLIGFKAKEVPETMDAEKNQDQVKRELVYMKQQQYYTAWVKSLKEKADISINTEIIN